MKILRAILSYPLGLIAYGIGFVLAGLLGDLMGNVAIILPPSVDRDSIGLNSSALGANILSFMCFSWIYPKIKSKRMAEISFQIILILIAIAYAVSCFIFDTIHLLWYSGLSLLICGISLYMSYKEKED